MNNETQAHIYHQLSCMEKAGFPAQLAFTHLKTKNPKINKKIQQLQGYLDAGHTIAESGYCTGVFSKTDNYLIHAGEVSGKLGLTYQRLSGYYGDKAKRLKQIKARLYLPSLILIIAVFIQPVPALIVGAITGQHYLLLTIGQLVRLASVIYIAFHLPFWLTGSFLRFLGLKNTVYQMQLKLPLISSWIMARQINDFLQCLAMMLEAGLPCIEAFPLALDTLKNPVLKNRFTPAIALLAERQSLTEALAAVRDISRTTVHIVLTGEQSGKLVETMRHFTRLEAEKISIEEDLLAEWIPRFFYFLIVAWMAHSIIGSVGPS